MDDWVVVLVHRSRGVERDEREAERESSGRRGALAPNETGRAREREREKREREAEPSAAGSRTVQNRARECVRRASLYSEWGTRVARLWNRARTTECVRVCLCVRVRRANEARVTRVSEWTRVKCECHPSTVCIRRIHTSMYSLSVRVCTRTFVCSIGTN